MSWSKQKILWIIVTVSMFFLGLMVRETEHHHPSNRPSHQQRAANGSIQPQPTVPYSVILATNASPAIFTPYTVLSKVEAARLYAATPQNYKNAASPPYMSSFRTPCWMQKNVNEDPGWFGEEFINCLPYFYVVGFPKSASTDIYSKICSHPNVLYPRIKEMFYWNGVRNLKSYFEADLKPALESMRLKCTAGYPCPYVFGDGTVSYMYAPGEKVRGPIHHFTPNAKIILSIRDPVERIYSSYVHFNKASSPDHFHRDVMQCIEKWRQCPAGPATIKCADSMRSDCKVDFWGSMYHVLLQRWLQTIPRENIYVVQYEQWKDNMKEELKKVFNFLKLEPQNEDFFEIVFGKEHRNKRSVHAGRDLRAMRYDTKRQLQAFFHPYNKELATLLNDNKWIYDYQL